MIETEQEKPDRTYAANLALGDNILVEVRYPPSDDGVSYEAPKFYVANDQTPSTNRNTFRFYIETIESLGGERYGHGRFIIGGHAIDHGFNLENIPHGFFRLEPVNGPMISLLGGTGHRHRAYQASQQQR